MSSLNVYWLLGNNEDGGRSYDAFCLCTDVERIVDKPAIMILDITSHLYQLPGCDLRPFYRLSDLLPALDGVTLTYVEKQPSPSAPKHIDPKHWANLKTAAGELVELIKSIDPASASDIDINRVYSKVNYIHYLGTTISAERDFVEYRGHMPKAENDAQYTNKE